MLVQVHLYQEAGMQEKRKRQKFHYVIWLPALLKGYGYVLCLI